MFLKNKDWVSPNKWWWLFLGKQVSRAKFCLMLQKNGSGPQKQYMPFFAQIPSIIIVDTDWYKHQNATNWDFSQPSPCVANLWNTKFLCKCFSLKSLLCCVSLFTKHTQWYWESLWVANMSLIKCAQVLIMDGSFIMSVSAVLQRFHTKTLLKVGCNRELP